MKVIHAMQLKGGARVGRLRHAFVPGSRTASAFRDALSLCGRPVRYTAGSSDGFRNVPTKDQCAKCRAEVYRIDQEEALDVITTAPPPGMFS